VVWSGVSGLFAPATTTFAASARACFLEQLVDHIAWSEI
jgi:hypothetical protein